MAKGNRIQVILECTEKPGSSRYVTMKNRRNTTERIELKKIQSGAEKAYGSQRD